MVSCEAKGHSGFAPEGSDIVCAAVSVLLRTTAQVLLEFLGEAVEIDSSVRGRLSFSVDKKIDGETCRLVYAADFLRNGIKTLQLEYPGHVFLQEQIKD